MTSVDDVLHDPRPRRRLALLRAAPAIFLLAAPLAGAPLTGCVEAPVPHTQAPANVGATSARENASKVREHIVASEGDKDWIEMHKYMGQPSVQ